jgi:hypothetical protein
MLTGARGEFIDPVDSGRTWMVREVGRTRARAGQWPAAAHVTLEFTSNGERKVARDVSVEWQQGEALGEAFARAIPTRDRFSFVHEGTAYSCEARPSDPSEGGVKAKGREATAWYVSAGSDSEIRTVGSAADDLASAENRDDLKRRILAVVHGRPVT